MPDLPADSENSATAKAGRVPVEVDDLHRLVLQSLDDDQAVEVVSIPLAGKSNIADHMVIASGRSTRQVASMAQKGLETAARYSVARAAASEFGVFSAARTICRVPRCGARNLHPPTGAEQG